MNGKGTNVNITEAAHGEPHIALGWLDAGTDPDVVAAEGASLRGVCRGKSGGNGRSLTHFLAGRRACGVKG